jgi:large subunit ribosomal protein L30
MGLRIKLVKSFAGAPKTQLDTIRGLGLRRFGQERVLRDTPAIRGMVFKVKHLVSHEVVKDEPKVLPRRKSRRASVRERARAQAETAARQ